MPLSFQKLIEPLQESTEHFYQRWRNIKFTPKSFSEIEHSNIRTILGERVRSKSEKLIADCLTQNHIPYFYEKPVVLKGYGTVYPDFTLMDFSKRQEVYWEHAGLLDDRDYREAACKKLNDYTKNGLVQDQRLIITAETSRIPLDTDALEALIAHLSACRLPEELMEKLKA